MLEETLTPMIFPLLYASMMRRLKLSITKMKTTGERGHPFLIPQEAGKKIRVPLIRTSNLEKQIHPMIQLTPSTSSPICKMTSLRKV